MAASHNETDAFALIRTKQQRPRRLRDLIPQPRLTAKMQRALHAKLILVSAQAGAGKTTLAARWLDQCPCSSAWLSLESHDNDLAAFLGYMIGAIQTVFPNACGETVSLLSTPQLPPAHVLTSTLVNELADPTAPDDFVPALDDYHEITEPAVHQLVSGLVEYLPQTMHVHTRLAQGGRSTSGQVALASVSDSWYTPTLADDVKAVHVSDAKAMRVRAAAG